MRYLGIALLVAAFFTAWAGAWWATKDDGLGYYVQFVLFATTGAILYVASGDK